MPPTTPPTTPSRPFTLHYVPHDSPAFELCKAVRLAVFVDELDCAVEHEIEPHREHACRHFLATAADGTPLGTARLLRHRDADELGPRSADPQHEQTTAYLTRVAVPSSLRGRGVGHALVHAALAYAFDAPCRDSRASRAMATTGAAARARDHGDGGAWRDVAAVRIHARKAVAGFYGPCGFVPEPELGEWVEERMAHVGMIVDRASWRRAYETYLAGLPELVEPA